MGFAFRGWANILTELKNWQLPLSLSRRKAGIHASAASNFVSDSSAYQRFPARAVGAMDPGFRRGRLSGSVSQ
jgi:hypothetical protein